MRAAAPRVILVEPRGGANVGAVCRAIKNMDAGPLVTVRAAYDREQARRMAVHAADVLERAADVVTLEQALEGCGTVVGTTAHAGPYRTRIREVGDLAGELTGLEPGAGRPPAFVFGPEDRGLSNREIALCHVLATIPSSDRYASLNLAQAVLVCLYEARIARLRARERRPEATAGGRGGREPADAAELEAAYQALEQALSAIGFLAEQNPAHMMACLRAMIGRSAPDDREVAVLRGLARQILWFAGEGQAVAAAKASRGEVLKR